jgi:hypothetical protein
MVLAGNDCLSIHVRNFFKPSPVLRFLSTNLQTFNATHTYISLHPSWAPWPQFLRTQKMPSYFCNHSIKEATYFIALTVDVLLSDHLSEVALALFLVNILCSMKLCSTNQYETTFFMCWILSHTYLGLCLDYSLRLKQCNGL